MPGFSVTLLLLPSEIETNAPSTELILDLLDEQPEVSAWKPAILPNLIEHDIPSDRQKVDITKVLITQVKFHNPQEFTEKIRTAAQALISAEPEITRLDTIVGDGDCGLTLKVSSGSFKRSANCYNTYSGWG